MAQPIPTPVPTPAFNLSSAFNTGGLNVVGAGSSQLPAGPGQGYYGPTDSSGGVLGADTTTQKKNTVTNTNTPVPSPVGTPTPPQGPSGGEIDSLYNPSIDYLNQAQNTVQGDFSSALDAAQKQYEAAISELSGNKQTNLNTINQNEVKAGQTKEDALSAARRLYSELRQGYQQRFGGATSAGQAASEISAVEQQRQQGQTGRQYADTIQQINNQRQQLETDYQTGVLKLNQSKAQAVAQAQSDFQNKLLQISQNRSQIESAKAQARLDALQQLRNQVFAIQQQTQQFQQTLELQKAQNQQNLTTYANQFAQSGANSTSAVANSGINTNPTSNLYTSNNGQPDFNAMALQGNINTKRGYDDYGNPVYASGAPDGGQLTGQIVQQNYNKSKSIYGN